MSAEKQKHMEELMDMDLVIGDAKEIEIEVDRLTKISREHNLSRMVFRAATDIVKLRRQINALAGLNPEAVPELVNMVGVVLREPLSEGNRRLVLIEGLRTALAAAKIEEK